MVEKPNKYPVGIQTFSEIREKHYLYVDKTQYIVDFVKNGMKYIFLSRPRRFGKSLFASTLQAYFEGRKELFEGLAIADYEKEWVRHPVFHFDLSGAKHVDADALKMYLADMLTDAEDVYGYKSDKVDPNIRLKDLVKRAYEQTGRKAVVIIDEYDAQLLDVVHEKDSLQELRYIMQNFYSPLKMLDPYLEFVFLTGITKIDNFNTFDRLNNLEIISIQDRYSAICGISKMELATVMKSEVTELATSLGVSCEDCVENLCKNYGGYKFSANSEEIINPFCIMKTFSEQKMSSCLDECYINNDLANAIHEYYDQNLEGYIDFLQESDFDMPLEHSSSAIPMLYHNGYLTIKKYKPLLKGYGLGIPNDYIADTIHKVQAIS